MKKSRPRLMFWTGCFLLAVFAALTGLLLFGPHTESFNENEKGKLEGSQDASLNPPGLLFVIGPQIQPFPDWLSQVGAQQSLLVDFPQRWAILPRWPGWRGPNRDGHSPARHLHLDWADKEPPTLWKTPIGDGFGSIAIAGAKGGDRVLTLFQDGDNEVVGCWDAKNGNELWRHAYAARFKDQFGTGPRSTPLVHADSAFTVGGTGILHCLDAKSGKVRWRLDMKETFGVAVPTWGFSFSPLVVGNLLLINPGGKEGNALAALDRDTGAIVWKALDVGGGYSSPLLTRIDGRQQAIFFTAFGLVSIIPETGKKLWDFPWKTDYEANIATPIAFQKIDKAGNTNYYVFISSGYNAGCALVRVQRENDDAYQVNEVYRHKKMDNHFSTSLYHKGFLYGFHESTLVCLDVNDHRGKPKWDMRDFEKGNLLEVEDHLIILGENGWLAVVEATPTGYVEKGRMEVFSGPLCWSAPALSDGLLFLRDRKELICLDLRKK